MIEGEEEVGSDNLGTFVKENKERLKCDSILISDTGIIANDTPSITTGLKGLSYLEVEVTGPNRDLHSGLYGGAVANPITILCEMIAKMKDEKNHITIPGFYDTVIELSADERADIARAPFSLEKYKKALDLSDVHGEEGYTTMERTGIRPTLDVNGIWGGYIGEGAKTVIPSKAYAKISMRLVPNQSDVEITEKFTHYFNSIAPTSVKVINLIMAENHTYSYGYTRLCGSHKAMEHLRQKPVPVRSEEISHRFLGRAKCKINLTVFLSTIHSPNEHLAFLIT